MSDRSSSACSAVTDYSELSGSPGPTKIPLKGKGSAILTKNPVQVARRNARERNRVSQVNLGFVKLRDIIPGSSANKAKKLSKVDTLRAAAAYIKHLKTVLEAKPDSYRPDSVMSQQSDTSSFLSPSNSFYSQQHQLHSSFSSFHSSPLQNFQPMASDYSDFHGYSAYQHHSDGVVVVKSESDPDAFHLANSYDQQENQYGYKTELNYSGPDCSSYDLNNFSQQRNNFVNYAAYCTQR